MHSPAALSAVSLAGRPPPAAVTELVRRWCELSETDRGTFAALTGPAAGTPELLELARDQLNRVGAAAETARTIELNGEPVPLPEALRSAETMLLKVIETVVSISKHAMRMVYALDDVVRDVLGAEQCVGQIDSINTQTRYLALNAAIEANRSGEAGAAFRVIAHEIKDLSRATEETSRQVRERIASISGGVHNSHKVLQEIATLDMSEHIMAKAWLSSLISGLTEHNRRFDAALAESAAGATAMLDVLGHTRPFPQTTS